jgi:beta-alanine degradation protein BauB
VSRSAFDLSEDQPVKKLAIIGIGFVVCLLTGLVLLRAQTPESDRDPVKLMPHMFQVRLENAYVRVLEYHSEPGDKEPMHFHPPGVVYYFSPGTIRVADQQGHTEERHLKGGDVSWRNRTWHSAENTGTTEVRALAIELKMPLEDLK